MDTLTLFLAIPLNSLRGSPRRDLASTITTVTMSMLIRATSRLPRLSMASGLLMLLRVLLPALTTRSLPTRLRSFLLKSSMASNPLTTRTSPVCRLPGDPSTSLDRTPTSTGLTTLTKSRVWLERLPTLFTTLFLPLLLLTSTSAQATRLPLLHPSRMEATTLASLAGLLRSPL